MERENNWFLCIMCVCASLCVCVCLCVHVCTFTCIFCGCKRDCVSLHICCMCVWGCEHAHGHVCVHVCVCVRVCKTRCASTLLQPWRQQQLEVMISYFQMQTVLVYPTNTKLHLYITNNSRCHLRQIQVDNNLTINHQSTNTWLLSSTHCSHAQSTSNKWSPSL